LDRPFILFTIFINQGENKMKEKNDQQVYDRNNPIRVLISFLVGGMAGAVTMMLFAPQSGKRTRAQIQNQTIQLRDRTTTNIKKAVAQVRAETGKLTNEVQEKAGELKKLGQDKLVEQLDKVTEVLDTGKTAIEAA
jgi:gas vesicle protein